MIRYPGTLEAAFYAVRGLADLFSTPAPDRPTMMDADRTKARADWCAEEVQELRDATNVTEQVDASVDLIVFALGNLVENGVEPSAIIDMVIKSQYAKRHADGKIHKRADGKVIKPDGWVAPDADIAAHIAGLDKPAIKPVTEAPPQSLDHLGMDGKKWAEAFQDMATSLGYPTMDAGWLLGWFCNAVMAGYDTARIKYDPEAMPDDEPAPKPRQISRKRLQGEV